MNRDSCVNVDASQVLTTSLDANEQSLLTLLERYLNSIETETTFDRSRWVQQACADHPELADEIRDGTSQIDSLALLAGDSSPSTPTVPGYQLIRRLGQGGAGIVYEAIDVTLDRRVALKMLPTASNPDSKSHARFMIEAQAAARLDHPNIVPIYRVGGEAGLGGPCFLSLKFIDGQSLDHVITRGPVEPAVAATWIAAAANAIAEAHACGIVHRDLKPSNLMIDRNDHVWVTDFGLARITSAHEQENVSLTQTGDRIGTMAYMSPQQATGEPVDSRTDVYSLGLTLFELLTGQRAITGQTIAAVQTLREKTESFHVRHRIASLPSDLDTIVAKATARLPTDRYPTAGEFADDLRRYIGGRPIVAAPPSVPRRIAKWLARHRRVTAMVAVSLILATAGSWAVLANLAMANQRTRDALDRSQADLQRTEEILDRFGLLAAEKLRDVDGAEPVRRELLKQTLLYYQDYADRIDGNDRFVVQNAITHFKAAQIIDEIGAKADAMDAYETSLRLFDQANSLDPLARRARALAWNNLAVLKAESGDLAAAIAMYECAIESLASTDLARTLGNYTVAMIEVGDHAKAIELIESGLNVLVRNDRQHVRSDSESIAIQAMLHSQLAYLIDDDDASLETYDRTIPMLRSASDASDDSDMRRLLARAIANRGTLRHDAADFRESLTIMESLLKDLPNDRTLLSEIAARRSDLGRLLLHGEDVIGARKELEASESVTRQLCKLDPDADHYRAALAGVWHNLGRTNAIAGDTSVAMDYLERSLELQTELRRDGQRLSRPLRDSCDALFNQTLVDLRRLKKTTAR